MFKLRSGVICLAILALSCTSQLPPPPPPAVLAELPDHVECADPATVPELRDDWDPEFRGGGVDAIRSVGGFYRALAAARLEQHRSDHGPTFRVACGDRLYLNMLIGVPPSDAAYEGVLVAFLDYRQIEIEIEGVTARTHRLTVPAGREHVITLATPPLPDGIHRLALIIFDDDQLPGLFGWHDLLADVYVGASPVSVPFPAPPDRPGRSDPTIQQSNYGVWLTVSDDRLRLAGMVSWRDGLELYASVYGSVRDGDRPVALVLLQGFEELPGAPPRAVMARAGEVTVIPLRPRRPAGPELEPIRALIFTNPEHPLAPDGVYDSRRLFITLASQKAYITEAPR